MEHEIQHSHTTHTKHVEHDTPMTHHKKRTNLAMPIAIVVAGIAIATAILASNGSFKKVLGTNDNLPTFGSATDTTLTPFDPATDHIIGNPNAPVMLIEYSDFSCPYCQVFHASMKQLMAEYGSTGSVAWVYRSLPIITKDSPTIAYASECVAQLGGNDAFWKFSDELFNREQGTHVDIATLTEKAITVGVDKTDYESCMAGSAHQARLQALMDNVIGLGVGGTPATFAIVKGETYPIEGGALPYEQLKNALSKIIEQAKE